MMDDEDNLLLLRYVEAKKKYDQTVLELDKAKGDEKVAKSIRGRVLNNKLLMLKIRMQDRRLQQPVHERLKGMIREI